MTTRHVCGLDRLAVVVGVWDQCVLYRCNPARPVTVAMVMVVLVTVAMVAMLMVVRRAMTVALVGVTVVMYGVVAIVVGVMMAIAAAAHRHSSGR